jgi:hypothetical protein
MPSNITPREIEALSRDYFPPYGEPDKEFLRNEAKKLIGWLWKDEVDNHPVLRREIIVDFKCILDIIDLVERRRIYYHIFHKKMDMNEIKEIALYCFWILKLQPFSVKDKTFPKQSNEVNSYIAYRLLLNTANAINTHFPSGTLKSLMHSFRYHDISKEAMIVLCESLLYESLFEKAI